jgi:LacI family transcriptional regulator
MSVTLSRISSECGVSIRTVSQILNRNQAGKYKVETVTAVVETAKKLGYRPNGYAQAMRRGVFGSIGMLCSTNIHQSHINHALIEGICEELEEFGLHLTIHRVDEQQLEEEKRVPKIFHKLMVDGLLVNYNVSRPALLMELVETSGMPAVWINFRPQSDCVCLNCFSGGKLATEYLLGLGHRRIALVDYSASPHSNSLDYVAGYSAAMASANLPGRVIRDKEVKRCCRLEAACSLLSQSGVRPSALIAHSPSTAIPLLLAAAKLGIHVPGDLSVLTFGAEADETAGRKITTMTASNSDLGKMSARMVLDKIKRPQENLAPYLIDFKLEIGDTCDCFRSS